MNTEIILKIFVGLGWLSVVGVLTVVAKRGIDVITADYRLTEVELSDELTNWITAGLLSFAFCAVVALAAYRGGV